MYGDERQKAPWASNRGAVNSTVHRWHTGRSVCWVCMHRASYTGRGVVMVVCRVVFKVVCRIKSG